MIKRDRDNNILRFIEQYHGLTISQCAKIFYTNHKFAYDESRKKLKTLENNNYIKRYKFPNTNEFVYCFDKEKIISYHSFVILNFYAELCSLGAKILYCQNELQFTTNKKCDAYFELQFNDRIIPLILEVDFTHNTNINKYDDIYNTNELQNDYSKRFSIDDNNLFPLIIIITYSNIRKYEGNLDYVLLPFNFEGLLTKGLTLNKHYIPIKILQEV